MIYKNIEIKAKHFLGSDSKVSVTILAEKQAFYNITFFTVHC